MRPASSAPAIWAARWRTAAAKQVTGERVAVACSSPAHSAAAAERLGCRAAAPEEILGGSKFVFLGVKPQMVVGVVAEPGKADIAGVGELFSCPCSRA